MMATKWAVWSFDVPSRRWLEVDSGSRLAMQESLMRKRLAAQRAGLNPNEYVMDYVTHPPNHVPAEWAAGTELMVLPEDASTCEVGTVAGPRRREWGEVHDRIEAMWRQLGQRPERYSEVARDAERELVAAAAHLRNALRALDDLGGPVALDDLGGPP